MATSGSIDFTMTRNELITSALRTAGIVGYEQSIPASLLAAANTKLNMAIKTLESRYHIWTSSHATVFLEAGEHAYTLGSSGDHASEVAVQTTISADEAAAQTVISVTSVTGMTALDNVGIVLDDGTVQWTTIASVGATTITINAALTGAAAEGNIVYAYTTKLQRPLKIISATVRDSALRERDVTLLSRDQYMAFPSKYDDGTVYQVFYDPQRNAAGTLYVINPPSDANSTIQIEFSKSIQDFDTSTDNPDFPVSYFLGLELYLAAQMCSGVGKDEKAGKLMGDALAALGMAEAGDREAASMNIIPYTY